MTNQFQVHYSELDIFNFEGEYGQMSSFTNPTPGPGKFLVSPQGIYEVATATVSESGNWDVYLRQIVTECQEGDLIIVQNKDRVYKCERTANGTFGFRKLSLVTLYNMIQQLEKTWEVKMADLAGHVDDLIQ